LAPDFSLVTFDLDNAPKIERTAESTSTKDKTAKKKVSEKQPEQPSVATPKEVIQETREKKKKEKKPAAAADEAATKTQANLKAAADDSGPPVPSMIDLRVGKIVEGGSPLVDVRHRVPNHSTRNSRETP
jgi:aminoacyl tRNA synthase complex-interacting multifunctional protein 1